MGPFSTVDLTTMRDCVVGAYSYVQAGEVSHLNIEPGTVWVRLPDEFNFMYRFPSDLLTSYIYFKPGNIPQGIFMDFVEDRKAAFEQVFNIVNFKAPVTVPDSASVDRFAVIKPKTTIGDNVLVAQRGIPTKLNPWKGRQRPGKLLHHQFRAGGQRCHGPWR